MVAEEKKKKKKVKNEGGGEEKVSQEEAKPAAAPEEKEGKKEKKGKKDEKAKKVKESKADAAETAATNGVEEKKVKKKRKAEEEAAVVAKADASAEKPKKKKKKTQDVQGKEKVGTDAQTEEAGGPSAAEKQAQKWSSVCDIAKPLVDVPLNRLVLKVVKAAARTKGRLRRGVREVGKALRKGAGKGVCIFAGDISPIDVISHLPVLCEEAEVPYAFVPSRVDLGSAGLTRRPTSVVLVLPPSAATGPLVVKEGEKADDPATVQKEFDEVQSAVAKLLEDWLESLGK